MIDWTTPTLGDEDRKDLQLNIDDILENYFLIADFVLVLELRERCKMPILKTFQS